MTEDERVKFIEALAQIWLLAQHEDRYKLHKGYVKDMCFVILGQAKTEQVVALAKRVKFYALVDANRGAGDKELLLICEGVLGEKS